MVESQSRYSIVERLTQKKLEIMSQKSKLKETVIAKQQYIDRLKTDLENWQKDIQEDIKREKRKKDLEIENASLDYSNSREQLSEKVNVYDNQIKAIEDALSSIEEISKSSS